MHHWRPFLHLFLLILLKRIHLNRTSWYWNAVKTNKASSPSISVNLNVVKHEVGMTSVQLSTDVKSLLARCCENNTYCRCVQPGLYRYCYVKLLWAVDVIQLMTELIISSSFCCTNHYATQTIDPYKYILHSQRKIIPCSPFSLAVETAVTLITSVQFPSCPICHLSWNCWSITAEGIPFGSQGSLLWINPIPISALVLVINGLGNTSFVLTNYSLIQLIHTQECAFEYHIESFLHRNYSWSWWSKLFPSQFPDDVVIISRKAPASTFVPLDSIKILESLLMFARPTIVFQD